MKINNALTELLELNSTGMVLAKAGDHFVGEIIHATEIDSQTQQPTGRTVKVRVDAITDAREELKSERTVVIHLKHIGTESPSN